MFNVTMFTMAVFMVAVLSESSTLATFEMVEWPSNDALRRKGRRKHSHSMPKNGG